MPNRGSESVHANVDIFWFLWYQTGKSIKRTHVPSEHELIIHAAKEEPETTQQWQVGQSR